MPARSRERSGASANARGGSASERQPRHEGTECAEVAAGGPRVTREAACAVGLRERHHGSRCDLNRPHAGRRSSPRAAGWRRFWSRPPPGPSHRAVLRGGESGGESGLRTVHVGRGLALSSLCICSSNSSANARGWLDDEPGSSHNRSAETGQGQRLARSAAGGRHGRWPSNLVGECSHRLPPPGGRRQLCGSRRCGANTQELVGERERAHAQRLARPAARVGRSQLRRKHSPEVSRVASLIFGARFKTRPSHSLPSSPVETLFRRAVELGYSGGKR
eukprot:COSAG06_NODE_126_length_22759_cov_18.486761_7_plen_277_part_00